MNTIDLLLTAALAGLIAGVLQWHIFMWRPSEVKPFAAHLEELRFHVYVASAVFTITLLVLLWPQKRLDLFGWLGAAFVLPWGTAVIVCLKSYRGYLGNITRKN